MAARPRDWRYRLLPPNLYECKGGKLYRYRNPLDGKWYSLGSDKNWAIQQAIEANIALAQRQGEVRLVDRITGAANDTFAAYLDKYALVNLPELALSAEERKTRQSRIRVIREQLGDRLLKEIKTRDIASFLNTYKQADKKRTAQAYRSLFVQIFKAAIADGWVDASPVDATEVRGVKVKRQRLTLEDFIAIYEAAARQPKWVQRSMELAMVTAQRREDVARMQFSHARDGMLWVEQQKTGARVSIDLGLRLYPLKLSIAEVIARCRDLIISGYLIHHVRHQGPTKPGQPVGVQLLTYHFALARDEAGIKVAAGNTPPTFHEMRSLAARLYQDQGIDVQRLLGHKTPDMTAVYTDARGQDWIEVKAR